MSTLVYLRNRRTNITRQINTNRSMVSSLDGRIKRLEKARTNLLSALTNIRSTRTSINRLSISSSNWRGNGKNSFDGKYDRYKGSVKTYVAKVENAKLTIDNDIKRYEAQRSSCLTSISNLQQNLDTLNWQIQQMERAMRSG